MRVIGEICEVVSEEDLEVFSCFIINVFKVCI